MYTRRNILRAGLLALASFFPLPVRTSIKIDKDPALSMSIDEFRARFLDEPMKQIAAQLQFHPMALTLKYPALGMDTAADNQIPGVISFLS